jgi:hypothetical protein
MYFTTLGQFIFPLNWLKIHIDDIVFRTSRTRPGLLGRRGHVLCGDPGVIVNESDNRYLNDVNVWWGKGKNQKLFPAKQITYGTYMILC